MERIILKISGASLKDHSTNGIIDSHKVDLLAKNIIELSKAYSVSIVIGGGNIWRGNFNQELDLNRNSADDMGMIATIINSLILKGALEKYQSNVNVYSTCKNQWTKPFIFEDINEWLNQTNNIAIFAGGTGNSFFSTDTAASLRAAQIGAKKIFMGKNGVDGVYSADPKKDKNAKFFDRLTFNEVLEKKLQVMDLTALTMCEENNIELIVFNIDDYNNINKIAQKQKFIHTLITK